MNSGILIHSPRLPEKLSIARFGLIDRRIRKHPRPVNAHPGLFADLLR
jgi:hypothetical protein